MVGALTPPWIDEVRLSLSMHEMTLSIFEPILAMASAMVLAKALMSCELPPEDSGTLISHFIYSAAQSSKSKFYIFDSPSPLVD